MNKTLKKILIFIFWIAVWSGIAIIIANPIILSGPVDVAKSLAENITDLSFWLTILFCFIRIAIGFFIACIVGCGLAILSYKFNNFNEFVRPLIQFMKSAPIVCFIVLLLVWVGASLVDIVTVIIAVTPVYYFAIYEACKNRNKDIANMLKVYRVPSLTKWRAFEWPSALPYFNQATQTGIGLSWKSGITAQMIGAVGLTIGERVYTSKLYLDSAQLLLWMFIVILLGWISEIIIINIIKAFSKAGQKKSLNINKLATKTNTDKDFSLIIGDICKTYGEKEVLKNVRLKLNSKDRIALTWPTGTGKTTLANIIMNLEDADNGEVFVEDFNPRTFSVVFQVNTLIPELTVDENILITSGKKYKSKLVDGTILAKDLSGGMKRFAEIERALVAESQAVIMDEPFAGLDEKTKNKAIKFINDKLKNRALILITHDEEDARKLKCVVKSR